MEWKRQVTFTDLTGGKPGDRSWIVAPSYPVETVALYGQQRVPPYFEPAFVIAELNINLFESKSLKESHRQSLIFSQEMVLISLRSCLKVA